jgi:hypothetical protein
VRLRCRSCGRIFLVAEYKDDLDPELEARLGRVRSDRVD